MQYTPKLSGYDFISKNSLKSSGGVGWFLNSKIPYQLRPVYNLNLSSCEDLWIEAGENQKIILGVVYRHPSYSFSDFQSSFEHTLDVINNNKKSYIVCGDFNIDLIIEAQTITNYTDSIESRGCKQLVQNATRVPSIANHKWSLLDHIYTSLNDNLIGHKIVLSDLSDHLPLLISFRFSPLPNCKDIFYQRDMSKFKHPEFMEDLKDNMDALVDCNYTDVNKYMESFLSIFQSLVNKHAPLKKQTHKQLKIKSKPWMNNRSIQQLIKLKNSEFRRYIRLKSESSNKMYKRVRNRLTHMIRSAKQTYFSNLFSSSHSDPRSMWKNIEKIIQFKNQRKSTVKFLEDANKNQVSDPYIMSNLFNDFFVEVGPNLAKSLPNIGSNLEPMYFLNNHTNSLFLKPVSSLEIKNLISDLDSSKSVPSTSTSIKFVKMSMNVISPVLAAIYNLSFSTGSFPDCLKLSEVKPLHKASSKSQCTNYRPVALLSPFAKILEKCLHDRIYTFFDKNRLFFAQQFGFQKHSSTENAVLQIHHRLLETLEKKEISCSVFVDLRKAFDTVDHSILLAKLEKYGVRGLPLKLLNCYLSNRFQLTLVNGTKSDLKKISCGIPQGCTLGPLLFLIYVNDIHKSTDLELNLFADDSYFSYSSSSPLQLEDKINSEMSKVLIWLNINKLTINLDKTFYMIITKKKAEHKFWKSRDISM